MAEQQQGSEKVHGDKLEEALPKPAEGKQAGPAEKKPGKQTGE